jgi:TolB-like protein/DNA-binding winged helix-turn-helix (wHTH) protein
MDTASPSQLGAIRFGVFEVDLRVGELRKQGVKIKLQEQPFQVLQVLLEKPGEIVTRDELRKRIWPSDTFVDFDGGVNNAIKRLREALGDSADNPRFIETVPRRGYRFIGPVNGNVSATHASELPAVGPSSTALWSRSRTLRVGILIGLGVAALLLAIVGFTPNNWWQRLRGKSDVPEIRSIAVLPLQNLSGDPTQEYFADAMTEELITELSHLSALKVISRASVTRYKNTNKSLPEIARELGVNGFVTGSVLRSGDRVRITAQLIYAPTDTNIWAQTYDQDLGEVLSLQSAVAQAVADEIRVKMTPGEKVRMRATHPVNPAALEAYLKGQYHSNTTRFGKNARFESIKYFEEATKIDPNFARAYVALAWAHIPNVAPTPEETPMVRDVLEKALVLDPNLSNAHLALARFREFHDWNFPAAEREFQKAIELNPNDAGAHDFYGDFLENMGRHDEGQREEQLAQELDPVSDHLMDGFNHRGQYGQVLEIARSRVEAQPDDGVWHYYLAYAYLHLGRYKEFFDEMESVVVLSGYPEMARPLAKAYAKSGYEDALRLYAKDLESALGNPAAPTWVAEVYTILGDKGNAFKWLERAYAERDGFLVSLRDPEWQSLRSDPRFQDLLRRVGLPP